MRMHHILLIAALGASVLPVVAQENKGTERTYFDNITLDPDGHICYTESLDGTDINRIEYREDGREIVTIYQTEGETVKSIETTDFDHDKKPDLITVEWTRGGTDIQRLILYRGVQYREHLKRHLQHALRTASHALIKDHADEQERAKEIRDRLDEMDKAQLTEGDVGIYSSEDAFQKNDHKNIRFAFAASDNLNSALSSIIGGDYRMLSKPTELMQDYKLDIGILLSIDPSSYKPRR